MPQFFNHQLSKLFLIFVRDQCKLFESTIKSMEGRNVTGYEAAKAIKWIIEQLESRRDEKYASFEFQREMDNVMKQLPFNDTILVKKGKGTQHERVSVNDVYLEEIFTRFYGNFIILLTVIILFFKYL